MVGITSAFGSVALVFRRPGAKLQILITCLWGVFVTGGQGIVGGVMGIGQNGSCLVRRGVTVFEGRFGPSLFYSCDGGSDASV